MRRQMIEDRLQKAEDSHKGCNKSKSAQGTRKILRMSAIFVVILVMMGFIRNAISCEVDVRITVGYSPDDAYDAAMEGIHGNSISICQGETVYFCCVCEFPGDADYVEWRIGIDGNEETYYTEWDEHGNYKVYEFPHQFSSAGNHYVYLHAFPNWGYPNDEDHCIVHLNGPICEGMTSNAHSYDEHYFAFVGEDVTFSFIANCITCDNMNVYWSGGGVPASDVLDYGIGFTTHWNTPGIYRVEASFCSCNPYMDITILEVDLDVEGITNEEQETDPGKYIGVNKNDNNGNHIQDRYDDDVSGEEDLVEINLSLGTEINYGIAMLELRWDEEQEECPIKFWMYPTKTTDLTPEGSWGYGYIQWDLETETMPTTLFVEGIMDGYVYLYFSYNNVLWYDDAVFNVIEPSLLAYNIDNYFTMEVEEEDPGAYVHFNLDNDNSSDNSLGAPKRPGADYLETSSVSGENDLKRLLISIYPWPIEVGTIILTVPANMKIWDNPSKSSSTNPISSPGQYTWNLSNESQRNAFYNLCSSNLYVEGINNTSVVMSLEYKDYLADTVKPIEKVKYNFIAADCGDQPTTTGSPSQRSILENAFASLVRCEWSITDSTDTSPYYNCIAWSVGETNNWYVRTELNRLHPYDTPIDSPPWGNGDNNLTTTELDAFYDDKGYVPSSIQPPSAPTGDVVIMYYLGSSGVHAARKTSCSCGSGRWIMYESKLGESERIEHVWNQLEAGYGSPIRYYKNKP